MIIRAFKSSDWYAIKDPVEPCDIDIDPTLTTLAERSLAVTVEDDRGVVGCGGVILYDSDNGELWIKLTKRASKIKALSAVLEGAKILMESFDGVRLYCRVREGFDKGKRLVQRLGFTLDRNEDGYEVYKWQ